MPRPNQEPAIKKTNRTNKKGSKAPPPPEFLNGVRDAKAGRPPTEFNEQYLTGYNLVAAVSVVRINNNISSCWSAALDPAIHPNDKK